MKLFDIKVFTSDREYDITLRNLTIIRASQIIHRISIASTVLLRSIKRFLAPGKVVIQPLILIRSIKSLRQKADVAVQKIRKRKLGEVSVFRLECMKPMKNLPVKGKITVEKQGEMLVDAVEVQSYRLA